MKILSTVCILALLLFTACDDEELVFPDEVILSCQEDVDEIAPLLLQGVFDELDPVAAFKGNVIIRSSSSSCGSPITDLSFFEAYRFWLGSLTINSNDFTNLDFLSNIEQFRNGLSIVECDNLTSINLPKCAVLENFFVVMDNPVLTEMQIGHEHPEDLYEEIDIDSLEILSNPELESWKPGLSEIDFGRSARIKVNPSLKDLTALSNLSMPRTLFELDMNGVIVNESGENTDTDSLNMPADTFIEAILPDNDYTWLSKAKITPSFDEEGMDVGQIGSFSINGEVTVPELCPLASIADTTGLLVFSTGYNEIITADRLEDECPE